MTKSEDVSSLIGGIWKTPDVSVQPEIMLSRWRVIEVNGGALHGERHIVGYNEIDREGRVSTAIVTFDAASGKCITKSGRVYRLIGFSGYDPDGEYVWQLWTTANHISETLDVSSDYQVNL